AGSGAPMTPIAMWPADDQLPVVFGAPIDEGRWYSREEAERWEEWEIVNAAKERERDPDGKVLEPIVEEVVISRALGQHLFGDGPLVGKMLEDAEGDLYRIVGVMGRYYAPTGNSIHADHAAFY